MKRHKILLMSGILLLWYFATGCAFNFALTSQRTALENQVMGTYAELEDDLVLVASVRSDGTAKPMTLREKASYATQNRKFNEDDVDELKAKGVLGEEKSGRLIIRNIEGGDAAADEAVAKLAGILTEEENRDRKIQWDYTIASNENLTASDLGNVREAFAKLQRDRAKPGEWIQLEDDRWIQKTESKQVQTSDEDELKDIEDTKEE